MGENVDFDLKRYVPFNYPEVWAVKKDGCPPNPPRVPRVDFTRKFFCKAWGPNFECLCPPTCPKMIFCPKGVNPDIDSLDYFSAPALCPDGIYPGIPQHPTMGQKYGLTPYYTCPKMKELPYSSNCPRETPKMQVDLNIDTSICGSCVPAGRNDPISQMSSSSSFDCEPPSTVYDISPDLPFRVIFPKRYRPGRPERKVGGAARCIHPSNYRDIQSTQRANYINFHKVKTPKQISVYRTPLVIDTRRPGLTIPADNSGDLIVSPNGSPMEFKARAIKWKQCKSRRPPCAPQPPDFQVCLPGPIRLPF